MEHRLSKIYTRTGDKGTTGLGDGSRVAKSSIRIRCLGSVDELNATIGVLICYCDDSEIKQLLTIIQHHLFDVGSELCIPGIPRIPQDYITRLESELDKYNETLPSLKEFILPGGCVAAAFCHQARTVCRRAECDIAWLAETEEINALTAGYINRLSDLLFVLARILNKQHNVEDVLWRPGYTLKN